MLRQGQKAPDFSLPDADMKQVKSSDFKGDKNLVLFFYAKAGASACSIEAIEFTEMIGEFGAEDTAVIGINTEDSSRHAAFRERYDLAIRLLSDVSGELCEAFDVWKEKKANEDKQISIMNSTFIIDKEGAIRHALYDVKPVGHAAEVLDLVRALDEPSEAA